DPSAGAEPRAPPAGPPPAAAAVPASPAQAPSDAPSGHPVPQSVEPDAADRVAHADDHQEPAQGQPHAPDAESLDIATIRRSWQQLLDRLLERRQMILRANLESVTAAAYDGASLELASPPGRKVAVHKVESRAGD